MVNGTNFNGAGLFKFALVDGAGAVAYWRSDGGNGVGEPGTAVSVPVTKGLYSVLLGDPSLPSMAAVPAAAFDHPDVRLRVWFDDGTHGSQQLSPDQRIAAVGYAIVAANVQDGAITSAKIASGAVGQTQLAAGAVGASQLANNAVGSAQVADAAITAAKSAAGAVGNEQLAPGAVSGDLWSPTNATGAPAARSEHTAVWTGSEMIVWGGFGGVNLNDGARYNPTLDVWTPMNSVGAPVGRSEHTAVWTGSRMIVWGGSGNSGPLNDGGSYDPVTDSWTSLNSNGAPSARRLHSAVWTGREMIVWGGGIGGGIQGVTKFGDGGRYDPASNTWSAIPAGGSAPSARYLHTAVWTGQEMMIWGGLGQGFLGDGARFNPSTGLWTVMSTASAPGARSDHTAVWTGTQMIIFGGSGASDFNDGAAYDPVGDRWKLVALAAAPRLSHTAIWTGNEMVVWGGSSNGGLSNSGERYNFAANTWAGLSLIGAPGARDRHSAVWSGSEMIIWGGASTVATLGDGARLRLSNIVPASLGPAQLAVPLQFSAAAPSGSTLSGANSATGGVGVSGVSTGGNGIGVSGDGGAGVGVSGVTTTGTGVTGTASSGTGVMGTSTDGTGVEGTSTNGYGVRGDSAASYALFGLTQDGVAVYGISYGSGLAGKFQGDVSIAASLAGPGNLNASGSVYAAGVGTGSGGLGIDVKGVKTGVYGSSYQVGGQYAGYFDGQVAVTGALSKAGGSFKIDHPLDPDNKYLSHSFVESPDMMNIYNGNIALDARGEAVVELPEWFGALNKEFRYQLTCLGGFAPVYVAKEIAKNHFAIAGGTAGLKVSWQVTGVRQDAWANAHRIPVEENKVGTERGSYLHPDLFGQPPEKGVGHMAHPESRRPAAALPIPAPPK